MRRIWLRHRFEQPLQRGEPLPDTGHFIPEEALDALLQEMFAFFA
jgi:hypothetical protein